MTKQQEINIIGMEILNSGDFIWATDKYLDKKYEGLLVAGDVSALAEKIQEKLETKRSEELDLQMEIGAMMERDHEEEPDYLENSEDNSHEHYPEPYSHFGRDNI